METVGIQGGLSSGSCLKDDQQSSKHSQVARQYDVSDDGRFLINRSGRQQSSAHHAPSKLETPGSEPEQATDIIKKTTEQGRGDRRRGFGSPQLLLSHKIGQVATSSRNY